MNSIEKAQAARADKSLQKLHRIDGKIISGKEWMETAKANGGRVELSERNRIEFNRTKYNRMDNYDDQEAYERKCNEKIPDYRLYDNPNDSAFYSISKTEYDYFNSL